MPWHGARLPNKTCQLYLGYALVHNQALKGEGIHWYVGCCCFVDWCLTSLVQGSVRVAVAIKHIAQHTSHSTTQHPRELQHSATTGSIYLALCKQHLGHTCGQFWCKSD